MSDTILHTFYDATGNRRALIVKRDDGSFGFVEEHWSGEPTEQSWLPHGRYSYSMCDTEQTALREARGRIPWLAAIIDD